MELKAAISGYATATEAKAALSEMVPGPAFSERLINERTIYAELGPALAEAILTKLQTVADAGDAAMGRIVRWLDPARQGVDIASPLMLASLAALVAGGVLEQSEADALLAMAEGPDIPKWQAVGLSREPKGSEIWEIINARV